MRAQRQKAMRKLIPAPITPAYRDQLPAGPAPLPADPLDRLINQLEHATNSKSLHARMTDWGWIRPDGTPLQWFEHDLFNRRFPR